MTTTAITGERLLALLATDAPFASWLAAQPPERIIGSAQCATMCPITAFVAEVFGLPVVATGAFGRIPAGTTYVSTGTSSIGVYHSVGLDRNLEELAHITLPRWASTFVGHVDLETPWARDVTAQAALELLVRLRGH